MEFLLSCLSVLVGSVAVYGAGARSLINAHEPKVPLKLRKDEEE